MNSAIDRLHIFQTCLWLAIAWCLCPTNCDAQTAIGNRTIASGDWFNDEIWEDEDGNRNHPTSDDGEAATSVVGGKIVTLSTGFGATQNRIRVGSAIAGLEGGGELRIEGDANLNVGGSEEIILSGNNGESSRVVVRTSGTVLADFVIGGGNHISDATVDLELGNVSSNFHIGGDPQSTGTARLNVRGTISEMVDLNMFRDCLHQFHRRCGA